MMTRLAAATACMILFLLAVPAHAQKPSSAQAGMNAVLKDFSFQGNLISAVEAISKASHVAIEPDWEMLDAQGVKAYTKVTVKAPAATAGQLLDSALSQAAPKGEPLTWKVDGQTVRIASQRQVLNAPRATHGDSAPVRSASTPESVPQAPVRAIPQQEFKFSNTPLGDVLSVFQQTIGVNMHVNWNSLGASNITKDTPVNLKVAGVSVAKAMDLVFEDLNAGKNAQESVYWTVDDGVVLVSTGSALENEMRTKVLDVADLLMPVPDFKGPILQISNPNNNNNGNNTSNTSNSSNSSPFPANTNTNTTTTTDEPSIADLRKQLRDNLITAVQNSIGKDYWQPNGKGSVQIMGTKMVITQSLLGFKLMEKATGR